MGLADQFSDQQIDEFKVLYVQEVLTVLYSESPLLCIVSIPFLCSMFVYFYLNVVEKSKCQLIKVFYLKQTYGKHMKYKEFKKLKKLLYLILFKNRKLSYNLETSPHG